MSDAHEKQGVTDTVITETLTKSWGTQTLQYTQDAGDATLYHITSETKTVATPSTTDSDGDIHGYTFTIAAGAVTQIQRIHITTDDDSNGVTETHSRDVQPGQSFTINADGTITETILSGSAIKTIQFVADSSTGLYAIAAETTTYIQTGSATTLLNVQPFDRDIFIFDDTGAITQVEAVRPDDRSTPLKTSVNTSFTQLETGYVLETITKGNKSYFEIYHDGNGDGTYTSVAHGTGTTVDLVGLKTQIDATIDALT